MPSLTPRQRQVLLAWAEPTPPGYLPPAIQAESQAADRRGHHAWGCWCAGLWRVLRTLATLGLVDLGSEVATPARLTERGHQVAQELIR